MYRLTTVFFETLDMIQQIFCTLTPSLKKKIDSDLIVEIREQKQFAFLCKLNLKKK